MSDRTRESLRDLEEPAGFVRRHIGPGASERHAMLDVLGYESLEALVDAAVPDSIRDLSPAVTAEPVGEAETLARLRRLGAANEVFTSLIGLGYSGTFTPPVIARNVLENPAWYTAYTPYQPEISQGRLEALLNFQTMVADLTGMEIANASLLDEGTAAAEAMAMMARLAPKRRATLFVDADCHPQTIAVVATRAEPLGIEVVVGDPERDLDPELVFGVLLQYPGSSGRIRDDAELVERCRGAGALVTVAADLLALVVLRSPGKIGVDIVVGSAQRFGVPPMFGGPHAGFLAVRDEHKRTLPGRLVGVLVDAACPADARAAHPPREGDEQHLHRAGAAGRHRRSLRGVPRARGARSHRAARTPAHRDPRGRTP
jgi:glycine dehydrogenase